MYNNSFSWKFFIIGIILGVAMTLVVGIFLYRMSILANTAESIRMTRSLQEEYENRMQQNNKNWAMTCLDNKGK